MRRLLSTVPSLLLASSLSLLSLAAVGCASEATDDDEASAAAVSTAPKFEATTDERYRSVKYLTAVRQVASSEGLIVNVVEETVRSAAANPIRVTVVINGVAYTLGVMNEVTKTVETAPGELTMTGRIGRVDGTIEPATIVLRYQVKDGALAAPPRVTGHGEPRTLEAASVEDGIYWRYIDVDAAAGHGLDVSLVTILASNERFTNDYNQDWKRGRRILLRVDEAVAPNEDTARRGRTYDLSAIVWEVDEVKVDASGLRIKGQEYVSVTPGSLEMVKKPVEYNLPLRQASDGTFPDAVTLTRK